MTGRRLYEHLTAVRRPWTEDDLRDPATVPDLWAALVRDEAVGRRLAEYLADNPSLWTLPVGAFARAITDVPGVDSGTAGRVAAVVALQWHLAGGACEEREPVA